MLDSNDGFILQLLEASEALGLDVSMLEKDAHVTRLIQVLGTFEHPHFQLVFAGGTCLAKAHQLVDRMSEDVDFKIQVLSPGSFSSRSQLNKALKAFRAELLNRLQDFSEGTFDGAKVKVRNEGHYMVIPWHYESHFQKHTILRPHVLLEFTLAPIRFETVRRPIEALFERKRISSSSSATVPCISVAETVLEKWVAFTRRLGGILRQHFAWDETLVRHLFDLALLPQPKELTEALKDAVQTIVCQDAEQFKTQYPEFYENPVAEIELHLAALKESSEWKACYERFVESMTYGERSKGLSFDTALQRLENLSQPFLAHLQKNRVHESFKAYLTLVIEQSRQTQLSHALLLTDEAKASQHAEAAQTLRKALHAQAEKLMVDPSFQGDFNALKQRHPESIAERGGFEVLLTRLETGGFTEADRLALLAEIFEIRQHQRRERQQDRNQSRGGKNR